MKKYIFLFLCIPIMAFSVGIQTYIVDHIYLKNKMVTILGLADKYIIQFQFSDSYKSHIETRKLQNVYKEDYMLKFRIKDGALYKAQIRSEKVEDITDESLLDLIK